MNEPSLTGARSSSDVRSGRARRLRTSAAIAFGFLSSFGITLACAEDDDEPDNYYERCDDVCRRGGDLELCLIGDSSEGLLEICTPHCEDNDDCGELVTPAGTAQAVCGDQGSQGLCVVPCSTTFDCPQPLICEEWPSQLLSPSKICMWRT